MARDFFVDAAQQRAAEIDADIAEINAGLARARANGDDYQARQLIQGLANSRAERRNLEVEYNSYVASHQPRQAAPSTEGEWLAKAPDKMDVDDIVKIFEKSKYVDRSTWSDPEVIARVHAGAQEVQRRKRNGQ